MKNNNCAKLFFEKQKTYDELEKFRVNVLKIRNVASFKMCRGSKFVVKAPYGNKRLYVIPIAWRNTGKRNL